MFGVEFLEVFLFYNEFVENGEVDGLIDRVVQRIGENVVFLGEDILFEGFIFVDFFSEVFVNGVVNFELGGVFVMERLVEVIREFVRIDGKNESVMVSESLNVMFKEIEVFFGLYIDVINEICKVEILGEIFLRDCEEKVF